MSEYFQIHSHTYGENLYLPDSQRILHSVNTREWTWKFLPSSDNSVKTAIFKISPHYRSQVWKARTRIFCLLHINIRNGINACVYMHMYKYTHRHIHFGKIQALIGLYCSSFPCGTPNNVLLQWVGCYLLAWQQHSISLYWPSRCHRLQFFIVFHEMHLTLHKIECLESH